MGIPRFFRWLSERYPLVSNLVTENNVPLFEKDNLYLDMNGIIHNCARSNDHDVNLSEEAIFSAIFNYVERLFSTIKPQKVFFLAVDGVLFYM
ncbi:putative 5-3 exonuclease [Rozella allomycis CSF55]|uniref:Putative 5-3 exonuclease n=1 Tax=Rozella allomycis (strain CSF55) TaxID=988480 RepID=A0A4P9YHG9_ROZAC|nr:putative 5-3 exonuclease [Rozella allomycis CSF55]